MTTRLQQMFLLDPAASGERSMLRSGERLTSSSARGRRGRWHWVGLLIAILSLGAAGIGTQVAALQARPASHPRVVGGTLKVWVPAAMIGDDYWIYANGRIVSAPPRVPAISRGVVVVQTGKLPGQRRGWELWSVHGRALSMHQEDYDNLEDYIGSASLDPEHIFRETDLALTPGHYTIELAIDSPVSLPSHAANTYDTSPFPFLFTRRYEVDIRAGETVRLYPGIPDNWVAFQMPEAAAAPQWVAASESSPPSVEALQAEVDEYMQDPMVKLLRGVDAAKLSEPQGAVVLDLPEEEGGPREFDKYQVRIFVDAIAARRKIPQHEDVAEMRRHYPQWSPSYDAYDKVITVIDNDLESLRRLGPELHPE